MQYRIVAVMPEDFAFPDRTVDAWRPLVLRPELLANRAQHFLHVIARIRSDLVSRVSAVPGVRGAGVVNNLPLSGEGWTSWLTIENRPRPAGEPPEVGYRVATPGYLSGPRLRRLAWGSSRSRCRPATCRPGARRAWIR